MGEDLAFFLLCAVWWLGFIYEDRKIQKWMNDNDIPYYL